MNLQYKFETANLRAIAFEVKMKNSPSTSYTLLLVLYICM